MIYFAKKPGDNFILWFKRLNLNLSLPMRTYTLPLLASILAVAITATMDFTGYFALSALPLLGLSLIFWLIDRQSKGEIGLRLGQLPYYGLALLYPAVVLGAMVLISGLFGQLNLADMDGGKMARNILLGSTLGWLMVLLTEEGFFRGWLWGALSRAGLAPMQVLFVSSGIFTIWHISAVTSGTDYGLPLTQIPIYLINAMLLGLIWGLLRQMSGSVIVPALSHAVWNAFAYECFGFGEKVGALGIEQTIIFGPEVGVLGILLNGIFCFWLWKRGRRNVRGER